MPLFDWLMQKFIYFVVFTLLLMISYTILTYNYGVIEEERAKVYLQALASLATLALLFYAYSNVASKRDEDSARLELAVRPILVWEISGSKDGALLTYRTIKHQIYDFHAKFRLNSSELKISERHIDVSDDKLTNQRKRDITDFIAKGLGSAKTGTIDIYFAYHSEVGGRYEFSFSKEVVKGDRSCTFQHRKFVAAKYPWKAQKILFDDNDEG
jgi:hypothetical protein